MIHGARRKLWIGSDHAGFDLKEYLKKNVLEMESSQSSHLKQEKIEWIDVGTSSLDSTDYPKWAQKLCQEITLAKPTAQEWLQPLGVLICGSGVGVSISANRFKKIRAVLALREDIAKFSRAHNASNVLCLSGRLMQFHEAESVLKSWFKVSFDGGRHQSRIELLDLDIS